MRIAFAFLIVLAAAIPAHGAVITFTCGETGSNASCISDEPVTNRFYPLTVTFAVPTRPEVIGYSILLQNAVTFSETGDLLHQDGSVSDRLSVIASAMNPRILNVNWCSDPENGPFTDLALCPLSTTSHSTALEDASVEAHGIILLSSVFDGNNELRFVEQSDSETTDTPETSTWILLATGIITMWIGRTRSSLRA